MTIETLSKFLDDFFENCGNHFYTDELAELLMEFWQATEDNEDDKLREIRLRIRLLQRQKGWCVQ